MENKKLRYFTGGNTAKGFSALYDTNFAGLERVFVLTGKSKRHKSMFIQRLIDEWSGYDIPLEIIHSAASHEQLDGFIIRSLRCGIIDGDHPYDIAHKDVNSSGWETIDLDEAIKKTPTEEELYQVSELKENIEQAFNQAYKSYETALRIHDDWEEIYIKQMDFKKANQVTSKLIYTLFNEAEHRREVETAFVRRRFLGAATPAGPVDFVDNLTASLSKRYFLKGRAGTGKSTLLKKIVAKAEELQYPLEIYHCGFDPGSLDMVIVRELGWCVFDSTKPHEYFPERHGDEIIDMYELTVAPGTDEAFATEIAKIEADYRKNMDAGKKYLVEAKQYQDELETLYTKLIDPSHINSIFHALDEELRELADQVE